MGRRTQQRRRRRVEELLALRHDPREFRRRWLARVDAWCKGLTEARQESAKVEVPAARAPEIIQSVLKELADIGEPTDSALTVETRQRLEAAAKAIGSGTG